ncbi:MAG: hypothetical protein R3C14_07025 [Caldilineaceae bacterium]
MSAAPPPPTATPVPPTATLPSSTPSPTALLRPTATPVVGSPLTVSTDIDGGNAITASVAGLSTTVPFDPQSCTMPIDIALASYPNLLMLMGCPLGPATFDPVALNEFGPGPDFDRFMLWFEAEIQIYVLFDDGHWQVYPDTWTEDQVTFLCNPYGGEPTSPPLPRRGFGKLWCTDAAVQAAMGEVAREERLCQHTVVQPFERGRLIACYEDATIRYFHIMNDGSWGQMLTR